MNKLIGLFFIFGLFLSCGFTNNVKFDQKTFNEQRQKWQESNIKNYKYRLSAFGFSGYDGVIIVENGIFKESIKENDYYDDIDYFMEYSTIDRIYETIEDRYKTNNNKYFSINDFFYTEIKIEYDKTNHIPIKIQFIYYESPGVAVDGTFDYEINEFEKNK